MANWFERFFRRTAPPQPNVVQTYHNTNTSFSSWNKNAYESDIYRSAVDSIARHIAKLTLLHRVGGKDGNTHLSYLLTKRPNEYMSMYDLLYKTATLYFTTNNAFVYISRDKAGEVEALYPINASSIEFGTDTKNKMLVKFTFQDGSNVYLPYADLIHLRRNFNNNQLLGENNTPIDYLLEVANKQNEGIVRSVDLGANIRGVLKLTSIANDEALAQKTEAFKKDYLQLNNTGGVVTIDSKSEYTPIDSKPIPVDEEQIKVIEDKVYSYLGISRNIVTANYTEDEFSAFYESIIEPFSIQLSQEATSKVFTQMEQIAENEIVLDNAALQFRSNETKLKYISALVPSGLITVNQALNILNLPLLDGEEGNKRLQTLNYVDAEKANEYQLNQKEVVEDEGN
ncbi:phage portal protein [Aerococcus urinaeequi]|uniref:phage portal protein n=1 Tax=Aerococcus urinaeequi TaxID=51665 RepID=UPI003B49079F